LSEFGKSTVVPVVMASTCGTNVSLCWSITARPPSFASNAPRGAVSRYTTDRSRSLTSSVAGAPPSSETAGRRSIGGIARRTSTRPRMLPFLAAVARVGTSANAPKTTARRQERQERLERRGGKPSAVLPPVPPLLPVPPILPS
jgi:hypothetical protein